MPDGDSTDELPNQENQGSDHVASDHWLQLPGVKEDDKMFLGRTKTKQMMAMYEGEDEPAEGCKGKGSC